MLGASDVQRQERLTCLRGFCGKTRLAARGINLYKNEGGREMGHCQASLWIPKLRQRLQAWSREARESLVG